MSMICNLILDRAGYKPVTTDDLKPVCGASWHNWVEADKWIAPDGRTVTTKQALEESRETNN